MDIANLIKHPEQMDRETLYDLRSLLALYPYYQTARLLLLQNLYILHDPTFNDELRRAAIYVTDRRVIFNLIEAAHYQIRTEASTAASHQPSTINRQPSTINHQPKDRTISLIDNFLDSIPKEEKDEEQTKQRHHRKPTPADAAVDYVSYLLETESEEQALQEEQTTPLMKGQDLIDNFINNDNGKIRLKDNPEYIPAIADEPQEDQKDDSESYFTETLAKIYVKQGRYDKALEIIQRLNLNYPKKNAYFADQMRFLEKLILNNKTK